VTALRLPALRLNHLLAAAAIFAAALAAWPWLFPPLPAIRPLAAAPESRPPAAPTALAPLSGYTAIVEHPLFSPSRRPPATASAGLGPSIESRYRLLGVVATGPKRKAFVAEGARHVEVTVGDTLDGWTISDIGKDRVHLTSPAGEAALKLAPSAGEPAKKP